MKGKSSSEEGSLGSSSQWQFDTYTSWTTNRKAQVLKLDSSWLSATGSCTRRCRVRSSCLSGTRVAAPVKKSRVVAKGLRGGGT